MRNMVECFAKARCWAVVGASENKSKFGYRVWRHLLERGRTAYPINPKASMLEGHQCFASLAALPEKPEVVSLIVPPAIGRQVLHECHKLGITRVWAQPGAADAELVREAAQLGLSLVYDECVLQEV